MILNRETGLRIRKLLAERQISVREVQERMGLESTQAVYKWLHGKSLPTLENMVGLSQMLGVRIEDILVNTTKSGAGGDIVPAQRSKEKEEILPGYRTWYMEGTKRGKQGIRYLENGRARTVGRPMPGYLRRLLLAGKVINISHEKEKMRQEDMKCKQTRSTGGRG